MGAANSTVYKLSFGATPVAFACQTDASWELQRDMVETSCKDYNGFKGFRPGAKGGSISVEGYMDLAATSGNSSKNLADALLAGTLLTVEVVSTEVGSFGVEGTAYVESFSASAPGIEEPVAFSATLRFSSTITVVATT